MRAVRKTGIDDVIILKENIEKQNDDFKNIINSSYFNKKIYQHKFESYMLKT